MGNGSVQRRVKNLIKYREKRENSEWDRDRLVTVHANFVHT